MLEQLASALCLNSIVNIGPNNVKNIVAQTAIKYLSDKKYYLSELMFLHGIYGNGNSFGPEVAEHMARLLMGNNEFMSEVKKLAEDDKGKLSSNNEYQFRYGDLYYAIQHCKFSVQLKFIYGRKYIKVIIKDRFDFDNWRTLMKPSLGNLANNLGYIMQKYALLKPYDWTVSFTYHY